jgi:hypothetical protein
MCEQNYIVFGILAALVLRGVFRKVKIGFEIVGHTHDLIDQFFSRLSVYLSFSSRFFTLSLMLIEHQATEEWIKQRITTEHRYNMKYINKLT